MIRPAAPRGLSLMEVLISIFVLSIGLLGLAALIPVGRFAIMETGKSDRAGACGRAAMREMKVRRMLDPTFWSDPTSADNGQPFAIDPLGFLKVGGMLGPIQRINLLKINPSPNPIPFDVGDAEWIFTWHDELVFDSEEPGRRARRVCKDASGNVGPYPPWPGEDNNLDPTSVVDVFRNANYTWFLTVTPVVGQALLPSQPPQAQPTFPKKTLWSVSVVVCHKRVFQASAEIPTSVDQFFGIGWGGGSLKLTDPVKIREHEWIMLCGLEGGIPRVCKWYRVVAVGEHGMHLSLVGPDWDTINYANPTVVILDSVIGVYTTTVEEDFLSLP